MTAQHILVSVAASGDPDVAGWAAAVAANGGSVSGGTRAAMSDFVAALKSASIWTKINRINMFAGTGLAACAVPLKVGNGASLDTLTNFVSGDYSESTGLTGNGTTKYVKTGLLASSLTADDTHWSIYVRAASTPAVQQGIGAKVDNSSMFGAWAPYLDGSVWSRQYDSGSGTLHSSARTTPYAHFIGSRTSPTAHNIYQRGVSVANNASNSGTLPALELYVGGTNLNGTAFEIATEPMGMYSFGAGLSGTDSLAFYNAVQAFQTALGRQV